MPGVLSRLSALVPDFRPSLSAVAPRRKADPQTRRPRPGREERVPARAGVGTVAGRVWFLPYADSTTGDTPAIRQSMRDMVKDPYAKSAWYTQVLSVLSQSFQVHPPEGNKGEDGQKAAAFCRDVLEKVDGGMVGLGQAVLNNLGSDGFSLAEKVFDIVARGPWAGKMTLRALKAKDPEGGRFQLKGDQFNTVTGVEVTGTRETFPITDFTYIRYLHNFDEPLGMAAFRSSYGSYWMRDTVRKLRIIHKEKTMDGLLVGTYTDPADKPAVDAALTAARTSTWLSIPEGVRIECISKSQANESDYKSLEESLREEIIIGIAYASLHILQGGVADARGNTKVQKAVADLGPWLLTYLLQYVINRQIIPDLIDYNFPLAVGYPSLTLGGVTNQEILETLQVLEGTQRLGFVPSKTHYARELTVQEADPNDPLDQLKPPPPPGGMFGGAAGGDPFGGGGGPAPGPDPFALPPGGAPAMPDEGGGDSPPLFGGFGEGGLFDTFAWSDWQQREGKWHSPGGRVLTDATYQRLKGSGATSATNPHIGATSGATTSVAQASKRGYSLGAQPAADRSASVPNLPNGMSNGQMATEIMRAGGRFNLTDTVRQTGWWTDTKAAVLLPAKDKAAVEAKLGNYQTPVGRVVPVESVIPKMEFGPATAATFVGLWPTPQGEPRVVLDDQAGRRSAFDPKYLGMIRQRYPDATFHMTTRGDGPLVAVSGGKAVGLVMRMGVVPPEPTAAVRPPPPPEPQYTVKKAWVVPTRGGGYEAIPQDPEPAAYPADAYERAASLTQPEVDAAVARIRAGTQAEAAAVLKANGFPAKANAKEQLAGHVIDRHGMRRKMDLIRKADGARPLTLPADRSRPVQDVGTVTPRLPHVRTPEQRMGTLWMMLHGGIDREPRELLAVSQDMADWPAEYVHKVGDSMGVKPAPKAKRVPLIRAAFHTFKAKKNFGEEMPFDIFAWADWKAAGPNHMQSPGGRVLRNETFQRLQGAAGAVEQQVTGSDAATQPEPTQRTGRPTIQDHLARIRNYTPEQHYEAAAKGVEQAVVNLMPEAGSIPPAAVQQAVAENVPEPEIATAIGSGLSAMAAAQTPEQAAGVVHKLVSWVARLPLTLAKLAVKGLWAVARHFLGRLKEDFYTLPKQFLGQALTGLSTGAKYLGILAAAAGVMATAVAIPALLPVALPFQVMIGAVTAPVAAGVVWKGVPAAMNHLRPQVVADVGGASVELTRLRQIAAQVGKFSEAGDDMALAGRDGAKATKLLDAAKKGGRKLMAEVTHAAVERLLARPDPMAAPVLFSDEELIRVANSLASTNATADLLGRARVRRMADRAVAAEQAGTAFSEGDDPFDVFAEPPPLAETPSAAADYFRRLVPTLGTAAERYGPLFDRHAFTLAHAADQVLLERVKGVIADQLAAGRRPNAVADIQDLLDAAGVSPANPQYAEMVYRTNMMDSYHQGFSAEMADPHVKAVFPAWQYLGVRDGRQGADHEPKFDRYYPSGASFAEVRGPRVFNCRCSSIPVTRLEWDRLQRAGERTEDRW